MSSITINCCHYSLSLLWLQQHYYRFSCICCTLGVDRRLHLQCDDCLKSFCCYHVNHDNCPGKLVLFGHCYFCYDTHQIEESGSSNRFCSGTTFDPDTSSSTLNDHNLGASSPFHPATEYSNTPNDKTPPSPNLCHISSLDGVQYSYNTSQDTNGCIPPASNFLLPDVRLPSASKLNIHPLELKLTIMINKQNLPPIMYNRIMSWASKAVALSYNFTSPQRKALLCSSQSCYVTSPATSHAVSSHHTHLVSTTAKNCLCVAVRPAQANNG